MIMLFRLFSGPLLYLSIAGAAFLWYKNNENKIEKLTQENERLKISYESCQNVLGEMIEEKEAAEENEQELITRVKEAEQYSNELIQKLRKHDLTKLTMAKPGLIESRINNATKEIFEELESVTAE